MSNENMDPNDNLSDDEREDLCVTAGTAVTALRPALDKLLQLIYAKTTPAAVQVSAISLLADIGHLGIRDDLTDRERYDRMRARLDRMETLLAEFEAKPG